MDFIRFKNVPARKFIGFTVSAEKETIFKVML